MMHSPQPSLIARDHTILGVCEALGEDFGFNPVYLRIAFAVPLIFSPTGVLAAYLAAGVVVLVSRLLSPNPRRKPARTAEPAPAAAPAERQAEPEAEQYPLPMAA